MSDCLTFSDPRDGPPQGAAHASDQFVRGHFHRLWINLPSQQRGCLEYRAVRRLFLVKVTNGCIQQCYYVVHPVARSALTGLRTDLRFADLSLHCGGTVSTSEKNVDRELQWTKAPSIEGLPHSNRRSLGVSEGSRYCGR